VRDARIYIEMIEEMLNHLKQLNEGLPVEFYTFGCLVTWMSQVSIYEMENGTYIEEDKKCSK